MKGVIRFMRKGNLIPRYIRSFEILHNVGEVAYKLAISPDFADVHPVFNISMLWWYILDESHFLRWDSIKLDERWTFVEEPVSILARNVRRFLLFYSFLLLITFL